MSSDVGSARKWRPAATEERDSSRDPLEISELRRDVANLVSIEARIEEVHPPFEGRASP